MSRDTGGLAFPGLAQNEQKVDINEGMTLRDYFAGQALQGMLSNTDIDFFATGYEYYAKEAYRLADAMLAERGGLKP